VRLRIGDLVCAGVDSDGPVEMLRKLPGQLTVAASDIDRAAPPADGLRQEARKPRLICAAPSPAK
jgi:hypothetical protein